VLLCGGAVTAGVLLVHNVADRAQEAVKPITDPTFPTGDPDAPGLPTDLPTLPSNLPGLGDDGTPINVTYEISGEGSADIVYANGLGKTPQSETNVKLPFKTSLPLTSPTFVLISAVRRGADSGTISCRIVVDGQEVAKNTQKSEYASVTCTKLIFE
jgi:hypothetical protein